MDKGQKSAEKESTKRASTSSFISPVPTGVDSDQYDVFLSFRGSDTRKGFTDYLYRSLVKAGIAVLKEDDNIPIGEELGSQILDAITRSKISIPIISKNYASSKWCLRELIHIMDLRKSTSHVVLPIFYEVNPLDVRHLKGSFGEAFHMHRRHFDEKDIQEGQRALREVSDLRAWESEKVANGHEGELVELVVREIISILRQDFQLDVAKHLVGIGDHVNELRNWVDTPAIVARMIGIYGMGGIGKTTLAKVLYNQLSNDFVHRSFLADIRETAYRYGIPYLQRQLIKDVLQIEHEVSNVDDGIHLIKSRLRRRKVLILLDDVDNKQQLDALARECNWFIPGSMIIVTTRNASVLDQSEFEVVYKFELNELDEEHAFLLFNRHAFRMDHSPEDFEGISRDIVSTMGGLPLALEVAGLFLYKKTSRKLWEDVLKQLKGQPLKEVQKILQISYDPLEDEHKQIFLDIACFLNGEKSKFAMYMWEDCGFHPSRPIEELKSRCLIKIGDDGTFKMHVQLRDFGRSIVCQEILPEKRSRLWDDKEASRVLMGGKGTDKIQAICLHGYYDQSLDYRPAGHLQTYTNELFKNLPSLRFLQLRGAALSGDFNKLFSELRWLKWFDIAASLSFSTTNLHLPKLVVLQLSGSKITEHWKGWSSFMAAKRLKVLDLSYCDYLRCTPDLSGLTELETLILKECLRLGQVDPSIGKVKSLVSLDLSGCASLKELPGEVGELEKLEKLILDGAGITKLPMSIVSLRKLEKLNVAGCQSSREIPSSIGDLQNLQHLDISHSAIEKLPSAIKRSRGLSLKGENPWEIGDLSSLKKLDLTCCDYLRCTPDLSALKELEILILKHCDELEQVHPSIGKLKSLVSLDLSDCGSLKELPEAVGELEELKALILDSSGIIEIPISIGSLRKLEKLSVYFCRSLKEIPNSIGDLENLQDLDVGHSAIEKLPSAIGRLKKLQRLSLQFCYRLKGELLSGIGDLCSLEILDITSTEISNLPESIRNLSSLHCLSLWGCYKLRSMPELPSGLTNLSISCQSPTLPQLSCLIHLEELDLYKCVRLIYIAELPSRLWKLCVASCHKLILPKFKEFMYLEELSIKNCDSIERLDLPILNHLKRLHVEDCCNLVEIQSHNNLEFLEEIVIDCCKSIERLILPELRCLKQLKANYCDNLVEIQGLGRAEFLEVLDISYCESIERLPDLSCFVTLKELNTNGCCSLLDVEGL